MLALFIVGRVLLGGFFIYNGINHFAKLHSLSSYANAKKIPFSKLAVSITGLMLIMGGLSILLNLYVIIGLWILILFMVVTTGAMHRFWNVDDPMHRMNDQVQFTKNLAIIGALLILLSL